MAVAYQASGGVATNATAAGTVVSGSITCAGTDRVMYCLAWSSDGAPSSVSSVVWSVGSQSFTALGAEIASPGESYGRARLYRLINPGTGSGTVTVTYGATQGERGCIVWQGTGIHQTAPEGTIVTNNSASGTTVTATNPNTANGQTVLTFGYFLDIDANNRTFNSASGSERNEFICSPDTYDGCAVQDQVATGTSTSPSWALSGTTQGGWIIWTIPLVIAEVGPTYPAPSDRGQFTLTGNAAGLLFHRKLTAASASFALTGPTTDFDFSGSTYPMTADSGQFTFTGRDAGLSKTRRLVADSGQFTLTGDNALIDRMMLAGIGSFTVTGNDVAFRYGKTLTAARGQFTLTGNDATLTKLAPGTYSYDAQPGTFTLTGNATNLYRNRLISAAVGTFTLTGNVAGLRQTAYRLAADRGFFTFSGKAINQESGGGLGAGVSEPDLTSTAGVTKVRGLSRH